MGGAASAFSSPWERRSPRESRAGYDSARRGIQRAGGSRNGALRAEPQRLRPVRHVGATREYVAHHAIGIVQPMVRAARYFGVDRRDVRAGLLRVPIADRKSALQQDLQQRERDREAS